MFALIGIRRSMLLSNILHKWPSADYTISTVFDNTTDYVIEYNIICDKTIDEIN